MLERCAVLLPAALAALSDGALRDQWQRVVKAAVLEVLAEPPPHGAPHWRLADLTGRVGASRRALEDGISRVAPARAAARRVLARCLDDSGRFHDISDGCGFASFARKQPYLRVVGFHADAAVHAVEVQAAEEGEADEARAPLAVGDRVRSLPCGHTFHTECVDGWWRAPRGPMEAKCPTCSLSLPADDDSEANMGEEERLEVEWVRELRRRHPGIF